MRRLASVLSCLVLGAGVAGCAGAGATPVSQRPVAQRPGPAGATTIKAATKNIQLVDETQNTLSELYYATRNLAAHLIPAGEIMTELRDLSDHATEISTAAGYELPASDPARPLIVRSAKAAASAASTLRTVSLGPATSDGLRATTGPMTALSDDVGSVARHVTDTSSSKIAQDVSRLQQALAVLPTSAAG